MKVYFQNLTDDLLILFASHYLVFGCLFLTIFLLVSLFLSIKVLGIFRQINSKHYFN